MSIPVKRALTAKEVEMIQLALVAYQTSRHKVRDKDAAQVLVRMINSCAGIDIVFDE
jgi:hypothetical protein